MEQDSVRNHAQMTGRQQALGNSLIPLSRASRLQKVSAFGLNKKLETWN
jgi:hypothetical protein